MQQPSAQQPPKLLDRLRAAIRVRHYSIRTEEAYVMWAKRFILFHGKKHPSAMGADEVNAFLTSLAVDRHVSASTQNQALSALIFLYREVLGEALPWLKDVVRAARPARLPSVLTPDEVRDVLARLEGVVQVVGLLLYGSGLRLLEALRLRVKDLDLERGLITVRDAKGHRDRTTMLPVSAVAALRSQLDHARRLHDLDLGEGYGEVWLPDALATKMSGAAREWPWQWVFPAGSRSRDPRSGAERRHHLHESVVQRAVREAARRAVPGKRISCHTFRHHAAFRFMPSSSRGPAGLLKNAKRDAA